jgi:shikimate dehydrogenase
VAGVIGHPIGHSLSPVLHNAAFAALGLDWTYLAFDVPPGAAGAALQGMRAFGIAGLSVTTPHKDDAARLVDRRSPTADRLGAVNTVVNVAGELVGESTDGQGFIDALRLDLGFDPAGRSCVIRGSGGAARAIVLALAGAGAAEVVVVPGRDAAKAQVAAGLAGPAGRLGRADEAAGADLVVNATTLGMAAGPPDLPLDPALLGPGQMVVDIVYPTTPFVAAALARGAAATSGLGMLLHQAAGAFRLWTGQEPPLAAMSAAALASLTPTD